jgi:Protein of unknown function (DUF3048) N-terminal domain/Protein of unknown function (DUF3048) C-terminal domain
MTMATVVAGAAALVAGACSGGSKAATPTSTSAAATSTSTSSTVATSTTVAASTTTQPVARYAFTGLPVTNPATQNRPALVVKIDNHAEARPQTGLNQADVVYEEEVEGITRFFAVFQSMDSTPVGPIRSARTTDVNLVAALSHPLFAWSGGNPTVQRQISGADLTDVGQSQANGPGGYHRDNRTNAKGSEHTLYADTVALYTLAPPGQGAPAPLFTYRGDDEPSPVGDPIGGVRLKMESTKAQFLWDAASKRWLRDENGSPHVDHDGVQIAPANVVIQFVSYVGVPGVGQSQQAVTVGEGEAWILTDGKIVKGTWSRPDPKQPAVYKDAAGNPVKLSPGTTWVELPEPGEAVEIPVGADPESVPFP